jgi:hypothetical protein
VVTASRNAGTGTLQGTTSRTAVNGLVSFLNLSHSVANDITVLFSSGSLTGATSSTVAVSPAAVSALAFSTQPGNATAGSVFGIQPVLKTRDAYGNDSISGLPANLNVAVSLSAGTGPLQGATSVDIGTAGGNGTVSYTNLRIDAAGSNKQLTATATGLTSALSSVFTVSPGAFTKLQLLAPGETAAPGTAIGKTGIPTAQSATVPFNVIVNAVDANWNVVTTATDTVAITSSDTNATLPANAVLAIGTKTFSVTLKSLGASTVTATDVSTTKGTDTSPGITVDSGPANKLTVQTQPSSTATAGVAFVQQPVIRVEDAAGNLVTADTGRLITASRGTGTGSLQGAVTATTVNGVATFANLSYNVAQTITLNFTASGLTNAASGSVVVGPAAADRLAFTTQPNGTSRTGSPLVTQPIVKSQDPFGNTSAVGLPSNLNVTLALTTGAGSLLGTTTMDIGVAAGNGVATFANLQCSDAGTNKQVTASASGLTAAISAPFNVGGVSLATGASAISADTVGGTYTSLTGPAYYQAASTDIGLGTIILNPPAGFIFDASGTPAPTVLITRLSGTGGNNINNATSGTSAAITSRSTNQITFTISAASSTGVTCSLIWQNVRVRPAAGTPLATGNLTRTGTATMAAVTPSSTSFGALTEIAGAANRLAFTTQPGNATAGANLGTQPVVRTRDQFGNNCTNGLPASKMVALTLTAGTGPLLGITSLDIGTAAGNALATFTNLEIDSAGTNKQLTASASGFTNAVSSVFTISAAAADHLALQTQPSATATAGAAFATQPVVRIEDAFGNLCSSDNSTLVTAARNAGTATLQGTTSRTAVNGVVSFTNLSYNKAETITLGFNTGSLTGATSSSVAVSPAAATTLTIQTQPSSTATAGASFAQQPVVRIEDQFGNLRSSDNSTVVTASRNAGSGVLQGTISRTAVNGLVTFLNLSHNVANDITLAFTGTGLSSANSGTISVVPAAADRLVFTAQPGSTAYGSALSPQPALKSRDPFGNDSTVGIGASKMVAIAVSVGTGSLQGTTSMDIGTTTGNGIVSFSGLTISAAGTGKQLTASASGLTSAVSSSFDVTRATVTGIITASNKTYDGTTVASIATRALTGAVGTDNVSLSGGTAIFSSRTVGASKTVTATGLSLGGTDAGNYQLSSISATASADITARPLAVSATGVNKPYDGTTAATVTLSDNRVSGDSLTNAYTSASFADKNVGTTKNVSVSGIAISGTDAANYTANTTASATADITARSLTVSATGVNKVYDGSTTATVTLSDNRVLGDVLTASSTSATFANKNVGTAKTVSVSGISISGTEAANYTANATASTTANISARSLTVSATGVDKVYNGTTNATVTLSDNRISGDSLSASYASAGFANKNVGVAKTVSVSGISISGTDAANYTANTFASTSASITTRSLAVSATGINKVYNATTTATVTLSDDRVSGDSLNTSYTAASFADKNAGTGKPVNVSGISVSGTDAANYTANTNASATADITKATVTALLTADNKIYDATTSATIATRSLSGVLGSDAVSLSGGTASFTSKTVGAAKTVNATGLSLSGAELANYQLASTTATTTADITARALLVSATGVNKVYDGGTSATATLTDNRVADDVLTASATSASFANKNIGTAKSVSVSGITISGTDAANYAANTAASTTADITTRSLVIGAAGVNRVYDGTTNVTVTLSDNRVAGDSLSTSYTDASFANKNAGTAKTVTVSGITTSGTDATNYTANTTTSTTANISAKALTVTGIAANDKVYSGTTTATINAAGATLVGVVSGDTVTPSIGSASGAFADKNVGTGKTVNVSGVALSGTDAANYSVTQPTTTATITKATLTVIADNKTRTASASNPTLTATYTNFVGGETLAGSGVTGSPALSTTTTTVAGTYPITISAGTLGAGNYNFTFVDGVLTVTADAATKLLVLLPGETAAPGTATGKTGTPVAQTAGTAIANGIVVNAVDANWNLAGTAVPNVTLTSSDSNAAIADDNGGTTGNMTLVAGTRTLSSLTFKTAGTRTITASATGLTSSTSGNVSVSPGAFTKLQLLVPGETAAPGTASGKTGTPSAQLTATDVNLTVNAVDANWNLVNTVNDLVDISSSDATATLPVDASLIAGTKGFTLTFGTSGTYTVAASDLSDGSKSASTSPAITVSLAQFTPATGGGAIAADGATGTFTTLSGPIYTENAIGNVGIGTIILNAPAGFVFDTAGTAPTVRINGGSASKNINLVSSGTSVAMTSVTSTQLTFTVTAPSSGALCTLTWQNVRVRPTAGTPLASGKLARTGTASMTGVSPSSNFGTLREVAGAASNLVIVTQPSATATAGVAFAQQPVLQVRDQFGTLRSAANGVTDSTVVTAARGTGSGTLQGTTSRTAVNGLVTFTNLSHNVATTITLSFSGSGLSSTNSSAIAVNPAAADRLVFATQPGSSTYGSMLGAQPVVKTQDPFGNDSTIGLPSNLNLNLNLSTGTGSLQGATSMDIGTSAGNGTAAFSGLSVNAAGTGKQLSASVSSGLTAAVSASFDMAKATVSGSITANSKIYDGTTAATIATRNLTGVLGGDLVSLSGGTASFASKTVGAARTVTATGLSLSGADAANYQLASTTASTTADITTKNLTVAGITANNKAYDGNSTATLNTASATLAGVAGADAVTLNSASAIANFANPSIGTAKTVTISGLTVSGADAANYTLSQPSASADITAKALTVAGVTANNKVYDGNTAATLNLGSAALVGVVSGDTVTLNTASAAGAFATKTAGAAKTVTVSGLIMGGAGAANYTLIQPGASADITAKALTISAITANNKVYDGSTTATLNTGSAALNGVVSGDAVTLNSGSATGAFASKTAGTAKTVTVSGLTMSGADAANYALTQPATTADITTRPLSISASAANKAYDGTTSATVSLSDDRVSGDILSRSYGSASFSSKNVGTAKTVSVSGLLISGADAANYTVNSTTSAAADITPANVTGSITADNKVYDGTTAATIATRSLSGVLGSDAVSLSGGTAGFTSKTVGAAKTVNATGLTLSGVDSGNYQLSAATASTTAAITARSLVVSATGVNRAYDGGTNATVTLSDNRVSGDTLSSSYTSASFADKNVGTVKTVNVSGIAISGIEAANYTANTTASTMADITTRALGISATGVNRVYDGTTNATVTLSDNRVAGDSLSTSYTSASFADKNAGTTKTVSVSGIGLSGADSANYTFNTTASTTANITAATVTALFTADNKIYDGTTAATIATRSLTGVFGTDAISLSGGTATFASKTGVTTKTVTATGLSLSGIDAANYQLASTTATTTADITARALLVSATGVNKSYDGLSTATVTLSDNRVAGDTLSRSYTSASFSDKNVGTAKTVSASGISISGTDAANYTANTTASTTADITAKVLVVSAAGVNKVYDGSTNATVALSDNRVAGDTLSTSYTSASFANKNVGTAKSVSVSGIALSGADAANYTANTTATTTANITGRALVVSATGVDKVYNGTTNATVTLSDDRVSGDSLTTSYTSASFANKNVGAAKTVSVSGISVAGTDAANYTANTTASTTANITTRALVVSAAGVNKVYNATTTATVTLSDNRVAGDSLSTSYSSASFAEKNVGTAKTVTVSSISISGTDAANYTANTTASTTANITAKALTVTGITANDKVYSGTTAATLNAGGATLVDVVSGDTVTLNTGGATGAFADKNVGNGKTVSVSGLALSGSDAANYSVSQPTTTANITKATLTVTADNKTRTASASNPTLTATYTNFVDGETLASSGVTGSPAMSTTTTTVAGSYPITISTGTLGAGNYSFTFVDGVITVTADSATKLLVLLPGETAAPGTPTGKTGTPLAQIASTAIANGIVVSAVDANWNVAGTAVPNVTLTSSDSNASISDDNGGTAGNLTLVAGTRTLSGLTFKTAGTRTITASATGLTSSTSGNVTVSPGAFSKLQLLVPGEIAAPGSATGKTGTPSAQISSVNFVVTVNAVDANWNLVNSVNDVADLTSSDLSASVPPDAALVAGTGNFTLAFGTNGSFTITASDFSDGSKTASTSPAIAVTPAQFTLATGGGAISANTTGGSFTTLIGPSYTENASGNAGIGTIILNAPTGFIFDTGGTAPTVLITRVTGSAKSTENINDVASGTAVAITSRTTTQIVFTVSAPSGSGVTCRLTWQNVRVRPSAGTPLASGNLTRSGTATVVGLPANVRLGALREVAGAASSLAIQSQPSSTATAGVAFAQQPVLKVLDQFGNLRSVANGVTDSTVVTAARGTGSGTLQGTTSRTAVNGVVTFTNLSHNVANNITLTFSATGVTSTNSSAIAISAAAADRLVFATQPGSSTYGSMLSAQPVIKTQDPFGNESTIGLPPNLNLDLNLSTGTGSLQGAPSMDIGTSAGNGTAAFSGLSVSAAGTGKQLSASVSSGLTGAVSSSFDVAKATVSGSITASGKTYDGTTAATIATRSLTGTLGGDAVNLSGGTASFASETVGTGKTVTATGLSLSGADAGNYQLASTTATASANITARPLVVSATGVNRAYDGTSSGTVTLSDNRVAGDSLSTSYGGASFADKNVGTAKNVNVTGITVTGTDAVNYTANTTASTTADITARPLVVSAAGVNKVYDGSTNATVTLSDNRVAGDTLSTSYTSASFANKNAGTAKSVSISGIIVTGADAANYTANTSATTTANITARALSVSASGANKVYDGNTNASVTLSDNRVAGDNLTASYTSAGFANKNVGTTKTVSVSGISLTGTDAANYTANTTASTSADITLRTLTVSATGVNRAYDGTANATVTLSDDRVSGDSLSRTYSTAAFSDKNVGTAKPVSVSGISVSGADAPNYQLASSSAATTANITVKALTVSGITASNKIYDGTTTASLNVGSASLTGVVSGEDVTLNTTSATGDFADKNAGTAKVVVVSALTLDGADTSNYSLTQPTATANITKAALTVTADDKTRAAGASNPTLTVTYSGFAGAEALATSDATGSPALSATTTNLAGTYPITVAAGTLTSGNYSFTYFNGLLTVTPATASKLVFTSSVQTLAAGVTSGTITVQRKDAYNNPNISDESLTVNLSSGSSGAYAFRDAADSSTISSVSIASGSSSASFKYNDPKAGTPTITAAATGLTNATQIVTINTGPFAKLLLLVPGETAAPGTATGKSGTPIAQVAGIAFNATVNAVDANWNLVNTVTHTVGITSSDSNATLPANGAMTAGTRTASVTLRTAGAQTLTASDIIDVTKTPNTSSTVTVNSGAATKLTIQAQPSSSATAGIQFVQQPVIRVEDAVGNLVNTNGLVVTAARGTGTSTLQGSLTATTVNGVATFTNLSYNLAETITINFTAGGLTSASSSSTVVTPAAFTKLQLLVPGETAAPGTVNGKTGTPTTTTAGTAFNVTVRAVDSNWNLISSGSDIVNVSSTDSNAIVPANAALVSGTKTLSVTLKSAGTPTLTVSDVDDPSKTSNTSPAIAVNAGAMAKLQLLAPGETADPGSATGKTGAPSAQTANVGYSVTVRAVDANWNLVNTSTHTVGITCTDPNDLLPANATLVAGTKSFSLTNKTAGSWTITTTDVTDGTRTANTSPAITVNSGAFTKLQILVPGETAAPGTTTGKTGTPTTRTAGTPFNVTVNAVDANWNVASTATDTVALTSSDANAALPANTALVGGTQTVSVTFKTAGTRTLTASDVTDGTKTSNTSPSVTVNVGAFAKLQVLVPGETAAPGSVTGKTGTPTSQPTGTAFNVTVNAVDGNWNLVNTVTHTVGITSSDSAATLPASGALTAGTRTASVTLKTAGGQTVTASDITDGTKTPNTSSTVTVNPGAATKLTIQTQPSSTATAGIPFVQQPVVRVEDAAGNLIITDNGRLITATRSAGTGTLQGTVTATTVNGIATFTDLTHNVATTITINFTASGLTGATSGNIIVSPASASQLAFTTQPSGTRTGSPLATQPVVKTQDAYGNTSSVGLPASLSVSLAMTGGSGSLLGITNLDIGTAAGNGTASFTTVQCSDAGTNKQITAFAAGFANTLSSLFTLDGVERATGGTDIPSSTAGGAYTTLTGPVYYEYATADAGTGTVILNAPAGFIFDTGGTAPTVRVDRLSGSGSDSRNINGVASGTSLAITSRTTTQITFTVSVASSSGVTCSLTWQNIRVRPTASSPLASGNITKTGTSTMAVVTNSSTSFGSLIETGAIGPASYDAASVVAIAQPASLTSIKVVPAGIEITFTGSPGYTYQIQHAAALQNGATAWEQVGTATTDAAGKGEYTDRSPTSSQGYYRAVSVEQSQGGPRKY